MSAFWIFESPKDFDFSVRSWTVTVYEFFIEINFLFLFKGQRVRKEVLWLPRRIVRPHWSKPTRLRGLLLLWQVQPMQSSSIHLVRDQSEYGYISTSLVRVDHIDYWTWTQALLLLPKLLTLDLMKTWEMSSQSPLFLLDEICTKN